MGSFCRFGSDSREDHRLDGLSPNWADRHRRLTERESDVMACFARGLLYKEVANELGISYSAVHKHQHSIFVKLRAGNRTEAITKWFASMRGAPSFEEHRDSPNSSVLANQR